MKDFSRPPTQAERLLGIVLTAALLILFGSLTAFLISRSIWGAAVLCSALSAAAIVMLWRASFGPRRALTHKGTKALAWAMLVLGLAGLVMVLLIRGSAVHRLMVLGSATTLFAAGLAGVKRRGHDA